MNCVFSSWASTAKCNCCGRVVKDAVFPIYAYCDAPCDANAAKSGPVASPHQRKGWGDHVADGLAAVGITKERVSKLVGRDCGCAKRQRALNAIGHKVTKFLRGTDGEKLDDQTH